MTIKLLVACREERRAEAHCAIFTQAAGGAIVATGSTLDDVIRLSAQQRPDVILLEHLPAEEERLWRMLRHLSVVSPGSRVLMLCELCTDRLVTCFIANGACGSVATNGDPSLWAKAVLAVHRGENWFGRSAVLQALRRQLAVHKGELNGERSAGADEERLLTIREREILSLIGVGMSNKEIGKILNISDQTVKTHLHHIYVKLNRSGRYKAFAATPAQMATAFRTIGRRRAPDPGRDGATS